MSSLFDQLKEDSYDNSYIDSDDPQKENVDRLNKTINKLNQESLQNLFCERKTDFVNGNNNNSEEQSTSSQSTDSNSKNNSNLNVENQECPLNKNSNNIHNKEKPFLKRKRNQKKITALSPNLLLSKEKQ